MWEWMEKTGERQYSGYSRNGLRIDEFALMYYNWKHEHAYRRNQKQPNFYVEQILKRVPVNRILRKFLLIAK